MDTTRTIPGFCPLCGDILPLLKERGGIKCYTCQSEYGPQAFGEMKADFIIHFNKLDVYQSNKKDEKSRKNKENQDEGPIVERKCPKCDNEKMSYSTLQLRSADEGQTVFYTCTKCKFKETENS